MKIKIHVIVLAGIIALLIVYVFISAIIMVNYEKDKLKSMGLDYNSFKEYQIEQEKIVTKDRELMENFTKAQTWRDYLKISIDVQKWLEESK